MGGDRDQLPAAAGRPRRAPGQGHARASRRCWPTSSRRRARWSAAWRSCARSAPPRTRSTRRRTGCDALAYSAARYAAAADALERRGDLIAAFAPHVSWTSAATHAVLPLLATDAGVRLQLETGIASHRAPLRRLGRRLLAARVRARAVAGRAARGGGRARRPASTGPTLGVDRAAPRTEAGIVLVPLDRAGDRPRLARERLPVARRLPRHAPAHAARARRSGPTTARPTTPSAAPRGRAQHAREFVAQLDGPASSRSTPSSSATTGTRA